MNSLTCDKLFPESVLSGCVPCSRRGSAFVRRTRSRSGTHLRWRVRGVRRRWRELRRGQEGRIRRPRWRRRRDGPQRRRQRRRGGRRVKYEIARWGRWVGWGPGRLWWVRVMRRVVWRVRRWVRRHVMHRRLQRIPIPNTSRDQTTFSQAAFVVLSILPMIALCFSRPVRNSAEECFA